MPSKLRFTPSGSGGLPGSNAKPMASDSTAMGTLMKNSQCHERYCKITPASAGPAAELTATTIAFKPMAVPSFRGGKMMRTSAVLTPITQAAPTPCTIRPAMSMAKPEAKPQSTDPKPKSMLPATNTRR